MNNRVIQIALISLWLVGFAWLVLRAVSIAQGVGAGDLTQDLLLGRALLDGRNPYVPIAELSALYLPAHASYPIPYVSSHAPPLALLSVPLAFLPFRAGVGAWYVVEVTCLVAIAYLCVDQTSLWKRLANAVLLSLALVAWYPVRRELELGQVVIPIVLLSMVARRALVAGKSAAAGALIGVTFILKPLLWPVVVVFLLRRQWRFAASSFIVAAVGYGVSGLVVGWDVFAAYFWQVLPANDALFRGEGQNISAWSIGWRVFAGTGSAVLTDMPAPPLVDSPLLATLMSAVLPGAIVAVAAGVAGLRTAPARSLSLLAGLSAVLSPIAWDFYLVLLLMPATELVARYRARAVSARTAAALLVVALPVMLLPDQWFALATLWRGGVYVVPTVVAASVLAISLLHQGSSPAFHGETLSA